MLKTKSPSAYTGKLAADQLFQNKADGSIVKIESIRKDAKGMWVVNLTYIQALTKVGSTFTVSAYDFERDVQWGRWKRISL